MLGQRTSAAVLVALAVVLAGFFIGSEGEVNFPLVGTVIGVCSSIFVSLNGIFTKTSLAIVNNNEWRLSFYNNMNSVLLMIPFVILFDFETLKQSITNFTKIVF